MGTKTKKMRDRIVWGAVAALLLAVGAQAAPPDAPVPAPKAGSVTALLPTANIVRGPAKQEVTAAAKKGDDVVWNDVVRTDKGGRARITLLDQSILSVGSQAELRIVKHDAKSQQTSIEVGYGRVRAEVTPITKQGGSFEIKTPTAVAGVIGTTFGIDSSIGTTTFLCVSGTVMVGSNQPTLPGRVPCTAGMAAVVSAGKAPTTRPATQQEIQQLVRDTEPAVISAMNPSSLLQGATADATITGTQLGNVNTVSSSSPSVIATLNAGGTATSVSVHLAVAATATPGPVTLTLSKPSGVNAAAVFTVLPSQGAAAAGGSPSIQGLSITTAPSIGGVSVTITGANFDANTKVMFGSVVSSNVTFVSPTQLTAIVPPENPGTVDLIVVTGGGMTTTFPGFSFTGPAAAITPQEITVNPGAPLTLDGNQSSDTLPGATLSYSWTLCSLGFKPPQAGVSVPATNAPTCNPAVGTVAGTDSMFATTPPVVPGQYFARLQVTDNLGASAVFFSSVTVNQANYLDPLSCTLALAQAFSTLQTGSATGSGCGTGGPATVLGFFDPNFSGLTSLQQALQIAFPAYSSMQAHLVGPQVSTSGNLSIVTANWQLLYTLKNDPACKNTTPCQPPSYPSSLGSVTTVWTLTPGVGWSVTDFRYQNGFTQGTLPAVPVATSSLPDLQVSAVVRTAPQTFQATVQNTGSAASGPTTVHFVLNNPTGSGSAALIGTADGNVDGIPAGGSGTSIATINLSALTQSITAQITATVNPNCTVQESNCANNTSTFNVDLVPLNTPLPNLVVTDASPLTLPAGAQQIQATVMNTGPGALTSQVKVHFELQDNSSHLLTDAAGKALAADGMLLPPLPPQNNAPVSVTITIPNSINDAGQMVPNVAGQLVVTVNPGCAVQENNCPYTKPFNIQVGTNPLPAISSLSPSSGSVGGAAFTLTVNGTGFVPTSMVIFGTDTPKTTFVNSSKLTAAIPAGDIANLGNFNVTVTNPAPGGGTSAPIVFAVNNPAPTITSLSPSSATVGGAAFNLTVHGNGFVSGAVVNFGGNARVTTFVSATQLTAAILAADIASAGNFNVTVTNPAPGGSTSAASVFTVNPPTAISITCMSGPGKPCSNPIQLNGPLTETGTITPNVVAGNPPGGTVTLTLTDAPEITSSPNQFPNVSYGTAQAVDATAAISNGGVITGMTSITVTPSNPQPPGSVSNLAPTVFSFNIGDINLSLPSGTICIQIGAGNLAPLPSFSINALSGFNVPTVSWQWAGLSGVTVNQVSGSANLSGATYALPAFTFTVTNPGTQTPLFAVTVTNAQGSATKAFTLSFNLSATPCAGAALRLGGGGGGVTGTWSRGALGGGGMAKAASPAQTGALPDLQINAASVSFSPSIPKPGDTVAVRFRVTNAGNADARHVPIALVVGGVSVASETFDIRAGASTLAALEWTNAHTASSSGSLQAAVVVDPNHTVVEKSTLAKSAPLVHFAWLPGPGAQTGAQFAAAQRATLEVADGGCVGFRFASGGGSACGSADVEISVEQMASGRFTLAAQIGIADLGPAFGGGKLAVVQYQPEVSAVAGHSYAVQLRGGKTGILRLAAIRNPGQTTAKSRQVFGAGKVAGSVGTGQTSGPVETGDVSGVRTQSQSKAYFDVSYQTQ